MATTDLKLEEPGSLPKPGPTGRFVRFAFGAMSIYYVVGLWSVRGDLMTGDGSIRALVWNGVVPALFLISYVVNIGFSRDWKKWPAFVSFILMLAALLATPGCEMRSIHHIYSVLTGRPTAEHHCPVGPLTAIDRWERRDKT